MVIELTYTSTAVEDLSATHLTGILHISQTYNFHHHITGCLTYFRGNFTQILKGQEAEILALFEKIKRDERHHEVLLLNIDKISNRSFFQWSMAFSQVEDNSLSISANYLPLPRTCPISSRAPPPRVLDLPIWNRMRKIWPPLATISGAVGRGRSQSLDSAPGIGQPTVRNLCDGIDQQAAYQLISYSSDRLEMDHSL